MDTGSNSTASKRRMAGAWFEFALECTESANRRCKDREQDRPLFVLWPVDLPALCGRQPTELIP